MNRDVIIAKTLKKLASYREYLPPLVKRELPKLIKRLKGLPNSEFPKILEVFKDELGLDEAQMGLIIKRLVQTYQLGNTYKNEIKDLAKKYRVTGLVF